MKKMLSLFILVSGVTLNVWGDSNVLRSNESAISFYEVPLICGAAPEIGCGSRLKPLFIDMAKQAEIKESWSNRRGTVIAVVWNEPSPNDKARRKILEPIFKRNTVAAQMISDPELIHKLTASFNGGGKWYKGMDVDLLSIEEAGVIAESLTGFAKDAGLITTDEATLIRRDIENYFKKELTQVRTYDNLKSQETQEKWRMDGYQIYVNHIGKERADKVSEFYSKTYEIDTESCCDKKGKKDCCKKL